MAGELAKKRIAVTGATRGIGRALAEAFAGAGARIVVHGRNAGLTAAIAADIGESNVAVPGDLGDPETGARIAKAAERGFGGLDVLVLNAGLLGPMQALKDTDFNVFREVMTINVEAQLRIFVACLPLLLKSRGKVIWMSSGLGRFGLPRFGAYGASKHALEGLMKIAAAEHGEDGLVSVAVAPGMVQTEMLKAALLGGDTSEHLPANKAGKAFVKLLSVLGPQHNGQSLDLGPFVD